MSEEEKVAILHSLGFTDNEIVHCMILGRKQHSVDWKYSAELFGHDIVIADAEGREVAVLH